MMIKKLELRNIRFRQAKGESVACLLHFPSVSFWISHDPSLLSQQSWRISQTWTMDPLISSSSPAHHYSLSSCWCQVDGKKKNGMMRGLSSRWCDPWINKWSFHMKISRQTENSCITTVFIVMISFVVCCIRLLVLLMICFSSEKSWSSSVQNS